MIQSGMQQQAIGLICAALGIGMVFRSLGKNGKIINASNYATTRIHIDAMKPSYNGSFLSCSAPAGINPWQSGNLPDPKRNGDKALIPTLQNLKIKNSGNKISIESISQLLWAARGRTPHFYKSKPWGMTIPTSHGDQNISSVYLIMESKLHKYVNWHNGSPTHSIETECDISREINKTLCQIFPFYNCFIVFSKNESLERSLWEIGYQILNTLLQAAALNLTYESILLDDSQKDFFHHIGINEPVSLLLLQKDAIP